MTNDDGIDPEELWQKEVRGLQSIYRIYPVVEVRDIYYRRISVLLGSLFEKVLRQDLRRDLYVLAREYGLYCSDPDGELESATEDNCFLYWIGDKNYENPDLAKKIRLGLGLTVKTVDEVAGRFEPKYMIEFFRFLYKYSKSGFLMLTQDITPTWCKGPFFFDRKNDFKDVMDFIEKHLNQPEERLTGFSFYKALRSLPFELDDVMALPCLFGRIDRVAPDLEERIDYFKIFPSIRVFVSPEQQHFYWLLKKPVNRNQFNNVISIQLRIAKTIGGDIGRCGFSPISRIPGQFNNALIPSHFISYRLSDFEYSMGDFDHLPKLTPDEESSAWNRMSIITAAKMISEHWWLKLKKTPYGERIVLPFKLSDYKKNSP